MAARGAGRRVATPARSRRYYAPCSHFTTGHGELLLSADEIHIITRDARKPRETWISAIAVGREPIVNRLAPYEDE